MQLASFGAWEASRHHVARGPNTSADAPAPGPGPRPTADPRPARVRGGANSLHGGIEGERASFSHGMKMPAVGRSDLKVA